MRIYKSDGSYVEDNDTEFGWYFYEIMVDESNDRFEEINRETRYISKLKKPLSFTFESIDYTNFEEIEERPIEKISPDIEIESIFDVESCTTEEDDESICEEVDLEFPPKDKLAELIDPCSPETKMLLSVISYSRYKSLMKEETTDKLIQKVNVKTTNFNHFIKDKRTSLSEDMFKEIITYHATKEDNMMSLMMELILTDVDCQLEDIVDSVEPEPEEEESANGFQIPQFVFETSDLGNSLPSISSNKSETLVDSNYLQVSNRANILSNLGLSDEDKSIQSICEETFEMHQELADIKKSFQEDVNKVNELLKQACVLKNDLRETLYLNDIINLLEGDIEKVKLKKLPFRIFYRSIKAGDRDINLII
ncbi:unnamed protein product [Diabrotica balteata]|uniref:Uncharacterized protein n=1 Tax=Diabrotica balteata TaxID=107213 RepID=A0A9N9T2L9_DIABA|nr:unnamed protein product [Diabrotica balteata]